ncbi:phage tail protein [Providencia rettgeri]|uniref:phage tail protein n=1 Tax=Providencia rettgeri TaxID=587 RepID=UPI0018E78FFE|nr:phage tail protein [Providencia rettgeri]QQE94457.1 phage tail protein [Providencia rettgeri]QWJ92922.1 phage tail protein [Providencia rettgeri]
MANENLSTPIEVQAAYIVPEILPSNFGAVYTRIVLSGAEDIAKVAGRANEAGNEAYLAQLRNDEQDIILDDHELRLNAAEETLEQHSAQIANHETRITVAEEKIVEHEIRINEAESRLDNHEARLTTAESDIDYLTEKVTEIDADYVSLSRITAQTLASPVSVKDSYSVNGIKVVGARVTGFTASTGTASKSGINASQTYSVGSAYSQSEVKAISDALTETRKSLKALEDMARSHGLIN